MAETGTWVETAFSLTSYVSQVQAVSEEGTYRGRLRTATATRDMYWSVTGDSTNDPAWNVTYLTPIRSNSSYATHVKSAQALVYLGEYVEVLLRFRVYTASQTFSMSPPDTGFASRSGQKEVYEGAYYRVTTTPGDHSTFPSGWTFF